VNSTHPDYDASVVAWQRARDVFAGEDAIKAAGEKYLARLDRQDDTDYLAYKNRASFFNASARTADGFVGLIFRRDPTFKLPAGGNGVAAALSEFVEDADMLGTPLTAFSKKLVTEIINVGRAGTLIDWNGEAEQRAYAVAYAAEDIINWHTERVNGRNVLTLVVLSETSQQPANESDPFVPEEIQQLRVLKLVPLQNVTSDSEVDWAYQVEIWQFLPESVWAGNIFMGRLPAEEQPERQAVNRGNFGEFTLWLFLTALSDAQFRQAVVAAWRLTRPPTPLAAIAPCPGAVLCPTSPSRRSCIPSRLRWTLPTGLPQHLALWLSLYSLCNETFRQAVVAP
jgi:hypothetical protein